jgi:hypothetical protein
MNDEKKRAHELLICNKQREERQGREAAKNTWILIGTSSRSATILSLFRSSGYENAKQGQAVS